ncbi:MAG: Rab geranylgeranyltransferase [Alyxoria varia]|nr:MAG: Rab geranylgeranyltransferase [Alyxoria varia]
MTSHGVPRPQTAKARSPEEYQKEQDKIAEYKQLVDEVKGAIGAEKYTPQTLSLTSKLLRENPEYYTIWNHRRRVLQRLFHAPLPATKSEHSQTPNTDVSPPLPETQKPDELRQRQRHQQHLITADLDFLLPLLVKFPKCYWIWNHRQWLLRQASTLLDTEAALEIWESELALVAKMLGRDSRNFHGWDYRRGIIAELEKLKAKKGLQDGAIGIGHEEEQNKDDAGQESRAREEDGANESQQHSSATNSNPHNETKSDPISLAPSEHAYTTKLTHSNLSNFSAWHNRSKLLPRLIAATPSLSPRTLFHQELALIKRALFTDPYDQSLWFYHNYLITLLVKSCERASRLTQEATEREVAGRKARGNEVLAREIEWLADANFTEQEVRGILSREMEEISDEILEDCGDDCRNVWLYLLLYAEYYESIGGVIPEEGHEIEHESHNRVGAHDGRDTNTRDSLVEDVRNIHPAGGIKKQEMEKCLEQLRVMDGMRRGRWDDWGRRLGF